MSTPSHQQYRPRGLDALFRPRSVAVYGASTRDPSKLGNSLLRNALAGDLEQVHAVGRSRGRAEGIEVIPSLTDPVDLALISVPAPAAEQALADAVAAGTGAAVILSSGFGETGPEGREIELRLRARAREAGTRLLGPNCMGVVSHLGGGSWLNGSYFWGIRLNPGPVSLVSQSGAFGGMFFSELERRDIGFSRFASLGNSADLGHTDLLEWLGEDPATGVIAMFAEAIGDGRRFVEVARRITPRKPVVVLKGGKEGSGARAAAGHTGSIAGAHAAARAGFRRAGVVEAPDSDAFFDLLSSAASPLPAPATNRVAIITISGGPSVLAADAAERAGLELPSLSPVTVDRIRELAPAFAATANPVDLTPQCRPDNFIPAVAAVFSDPAVDGVIAINCGLDLPTFGEGVARAVAATGKPAVGYVLDAPGVAKAMREAGVPLFPSPERAARGYLGLTRERRADVEEVRR